MPSTIDRPTELSPQYAELIADLFTEVIGKMLSPQVIKEVCGEEITLAQIHALRYLYRHESECAVTELAEGLTVSTPAATKLIDRLAKHNWVIRREDEIDHRVFHVRLTSHGRDVVRKIKELRTKRISQIIESMTPESRQALLNGIETFIHTALTDDNMGEAICQHCGTDAFDNCIINRTQAEKIHTTDSSVVCS